MSKSLTLLRLFFNFNFSKHHFEKTVLFRHPVLSFLEKLAKYFGPLRKIKKEQLYSSENVGDQTNGFGVFQLANIAVENDPIIVND